MAPKILIVLTSHDQLGDTGKKTGFWLEEFAAPYYTFKVSIQTRTIESIPKPPNTLTLEFASEQDGGAEITLASPKGGMPPLDPVQT